MSMNLILESISSDADVATSQPTAVAESQQSEFTLKLFGDDPSNAATIGGVFHDDDDYDEVAVEDRICLEKAWHGLHFLLTDEPWSGTGWRAFLLSGGEEHGEDMGYGPARRFAPNEVGEINDVLMGITDEALWSRYDAAEMTKADIYPGIWDEPEEDLREEYLQYFRTLKEFVAQTAEIGNTLQVYME